MLSRRGPSQLQRGIGVAMFQIQVVKMIMYGMINGKRLPDFFDDWVQRGFTGLIDTPFQLMLSISTIPALLERSRNILDRGYNFVPSQRHIDRLVAIIRDGAALDDELTRDANLLSADMTNPNTQTSWIASNWGFFVSSRIVLKRLLESALLWLDSWTRRSYYSHPLPIPALLHRAQSTQIAMISELIRIIPSSLGLANHFPDTPVAGPSAPLASYFLMWPLYVALHGTKQTTSAQRSWFRKVLRHIAYVEGLQMATALAEEPFELLDRMASLDLNS